MHSSLSLRFARVRSFIGLLPIAFAAAGARSAAQATWFVDDTAAGTNSGTSWTNAYTDLQSALNVAVSGDQIWVAQGTYLPSVQNNPPDPRSVTFLLTSGVNVYGGFAGTETSLAMRAGLFSSTILSGDIGVVGSATDNAHHVVKVETAGLRILDGFTIRDGNAQNGSGSSKGGGVHASLMTTGASPWLQLVNCDIVSNIADRGAGIAVFNIARVDLLRCRVENNRAVADGGGVHVLTGFMTCMNTEFLDNRAGGDGGAVFVNSTGSASSGMVRFGNVLFAGNRATNSGGALFMPGGAFVNGSATVLDSTFSDNRGATGGAIFADTTSTIKAQLNMANSIVWGNVSTSGAQVVGTALAITYCDVSGGYGGTGNINADPLFANAAGGDYRTTAGSPANDSGNNSLISLDYLDLDGDAVTTGEYAPLDLDGRRRRADDASAADTGSGSAPLVDMGPYEL